MLYTSPFTFARRELSIEEADYGILGVPYDSSQSYLTGSRDAPQSIRGASREIEDYDLAEGFDLRSLKLADLGDVEVSWGSFEETRKRVGREVGAVVERGKTPILLGGEHTINPFALEAYREKPFLLYFDAHLDFRESYLGNPYSHASALRRASEVVGEENLLALGIRSASREEVEEARDRGVNFIPIEECYPPEELSRRLVEELRGKKVYLSLDMDFFDPKDARGVGNPEPYGMLYFDFLMTLGYLGVIEIAGMEVCEVIPSYDHYTPVLASKLIFKILAKHHKLRLQEVV